MSNHSLNINRLAIKENDDSLFQNVIHLVKCKLCLCVLTDPYDCLCCNQTFCFTCINNFILKNKKCPNNSNSVDKEEMVALSKLKPSSENLTEFLSKLKFTCINAPNGCIEVTDYNDIMSHEMNCVHSVNKQSDQSNRLKSENIINNYIINNHSRSINILSSENSVNSINDSLQKNLSIMSFNCNNRLDQIEFEKDTSLSHEIFSSNNDKLDKILEGLQVLQYSVGSKNLMTTPSKECLTETPNFSLINPTVNHYYKKSSSDNNMPSYNLTLSLQQEKIISELESINEKISKLENNINEKEDNKMKFIEEQLNNFCDKLQMSQTQMSHMSHMSHMSTTAYSSQANSIGNSSLLKSFLPKSKSSGKFDIISSTALKKVKCDNKPKLNKEKDRRLPTPLKTINALSLLPPSNNGLISPRLYNNKTSQKKESKVFSNNTLKIPTSNTTAPAVETHIKLKDQINSLVENLNDKLLDKFDRLDKNMFAYYHNDMEVMIKSMNELLVEDIKTTFVEVILDSTNLITQKFEDIMIRLHVRQF